MTLNLAKPAARLGASRARPRQLVGEGPPFAKVVSNERADALAGEGRRIAPVALGIEVGLLATFDGATR